MIESSYEAPQIGFGGPVASEDIPHFRAAQAASRLRGAAMPRPGIVGVIQQDIW